jgi:hypothetical protein
MELGHLSVLLLHMNHANYVRLINEYDPYTVITKITMKLSYYYCFLILRHRDYGDYGG